MSSHRFFGFKFVVAVGVSSVVVMATGFSSSAATTAAPASPLPAVSVVPSPEVQTSPGAAAVARPTSAPSVDRAALLREFKKAQHSSLAALQHRHKMELKSLKSAQNAAYQEWKTQETDKRRKFFDEHRSGKDRRTYVQDMNARRKALFQLQSDERTRRVQEQKARLESEKESQARNLKDFSEQLQRGETPSANLWPQPGF